MAHGMLDDDIWVLDPYCFCTDRHWLTVGAIDTGEGVPSNGHGVLGALPGLSDDDTALLAALLTALALFLFLLFLLLCCLYPWGVCGPCCAGGKKSSSSHGHDQRSDTSSDRVHLTAVDMKIPRAWTDSQDGLSLSETGKARRGKAWNAMADGDEMDWKTGKGGFANEAFQGQDFQEGWFSTADLDSVYGTTTGSRRGAKAHDYLANREEIYRGQVKDTTSSHLSRSLNHLDTILTYGRDGRYHGNAADSFTYQQVSGEQQDGGSLVDALTLMRTMALVRPAPRSRSATQDGNSLTSNNMVSEVSLVNTQRREDFPSITSLVPYPTNAESQRELTNMESGLVTKASPITSPQWMLRGSSEAPPVGANSEVIQHYTSTVRRTVEETSTSE